jgi:hypothetical protein
MKANVNELERHDESTFFSYSTYKNDETLSLGENMRNRMFALHKLKIKEQKRIKELLGENTN